MNADTITIPPVIKTVTVPCTAEEAFRFFTADFAKWWPLATHSCIAFESGHTQAPAGCRFETREGGRIVERGHAGEEHVWGTITRWAPPSSVAFTWHPGRPEGTGQSVTITFTPVASGTEVVLTHSGWDSRDPNARKERDSYDSGWENVFKVSFADYAGGKK